MAHESARTGSTNATVSRPYRSHKFPACDFCRRRKSRCTRDLDDRPCLLCRIHGKECTQGATRTLGEDSRAQESPVLHKRRTRTNNTITSSVRDDIHEVSIPSGGRDVDFADISSHGNVQTSPQQPAQTHTGHIVGPVVARDVQVLEQYMSPENNLAVSYTRPNPYSIFSNDIRNPIVYLKVPRRRVPPSHGNGSTGYKQFECIERIIEPLGKDILELYFEAFHPSFPILDEKTVLEGYQQDGLPYAIICEIYAVSLVFWDRSRIISQTKRPRPDVRYVWSKAVSALNDDFVAPGFSTVIACVLDLTGRPTTSMTYNSLNIGKSVALSQSLGLNRDPSNWNLDQRQKNLRIRTWWGVLIHDLWGSLTHGTPPHIHPMQCDVAVPSLDTLVVSPPEGCDERNSSISRNSGGHTFIALCQLTEILGDVLPLVYNARRQKQNNASTSLLRIEASLNEWEEAIPKWMNAKMADYQRRLPGVLNLQLSFLAVKICICRLSILEYSRSDGSGDSDAKQFHQARCRTAARAVVEFVCSLQDSELNVFWLPYASYHFTSAATLLLRCALEATNDQIAKECVTSARTLLERLKRFKDKFKWDLADLCISQCHAVVEKMSDETYLDFRRQHMQTSKESSASSIQTKRISNHEGTQGYLNSLHTTGEHGVDPVAVTSDAFSVEDFMNLEQWDNLWQLPMPDLWQLPGVNEPYDF